MFKVIAFAINISAHVLTLGSNPKDSVLFENYLSPMQVKQFNFQPFSVLQNVEPKVKLKYGPADSAIMPLGMDSGYPTHENNFARAVKENAYHILKNSVAYKKRSPSY